MIATALGGGSPIDYALLVVARWREERERDGVPNATAVWNAMEHAGSAVVFSGTTVAISLLALIAVPVPGAAQHRRRRAADRARQRRRRDHGGGILIDATIVRGILAPAAVALFGRRNWWLPPGAARLLRVAASPATADSAVPEPAPQLA